MAIPTQPGQVGYLPGTLFLACKGCGTTSVLFTGDPPVFPVTYDCIGCQKRWTVVEPLPYHLDYRWFPITKEKPNADTAPA